MLHRILISGLVMVGCLTAASCQTAPSANSDGTGGQESQDGTGGTQEPPAPVVTQEPCTTLDGCDGQAECVDGACGECVCERFVAVGRADLDLNSSLIAAATLPNDDLVVLLSDAQFGSPLVRFAGSSLTAEPELIRVETELLAPQALYVGPEGESLLVVTAQGVSSLTPAGAVNWTYTAPGAIHDWTQYEDGDVAVLQTNSEGTYRELSRVDVDTGLHTISHRWEDELPWAVEVDDETLVAATTSASTLEAYVVVYQEPEIRVDTGIETAPNTTIDNEGIYIYDLALADGGGSYVISYKAEPLDDSGNTFTPIAALAAYDHEAMVWGHGWRRDVDASGASGNSMATRVLSFAGGFSYERSSYVRLISSAGVSLDEMLECYNSARLTSNRLLCQDRAGLAIYELTFPPAGLLPDSSACTAAAECFGGACCVDGASGEGTCGDEPCSAGYRCTDDAGCLSGHCVGGQCANACETIGCSPARCIPEVLDEPVCFPDCLDASACEAYPGLSCTETMDDSGNTVFACLP